jgi:hypothetical protein
MLAINRIRDPSRLLLLQFQFSPCPRDAAMMRLFLGIYSNVSLTFGPASKLTAKLIPISPLVVPGLFFVVFPKLLASVSSTQ